MKDKIIYKTNCINKNDILNNVSAIEEGKQFKIDEKSQNYLNLRLIKSLFHILFNQNKINKKEYDSLIAGVNRTFNII